MGIGIDDLYDEEDDIQLEPQPVSQPVSQPPVVDNQEPEDSDDDFMRDFLKSKGIEDPSKIKFEEGDQIVERNWDDLTREEQINILNTPVTSQSQPEDFLSSEEIELLNNIRQSKLTPSQYIEQLQQPVVQEPRYKVDDFSDDELYILDLESRVGELSDDEAAQALSIAKQNEDFYQKQIEGIRKEYKQREEEQSQYDLAEQEEQQRQAFEQYQSMVVDAIDNFNSVGNLDLAFEDSDKEQLAEFILSQDNSGLNYFYKAMQDPQTLVKAAWFILNGDEAFNSIQDYFTNQIKLVSENQYKKGLEDGKKGTSSKPTVVIDNSKKTQHRQYKSIEDLDDD